MAAGGGRTASASPQLIAKDCSERIIGLGRGRLLAGAGLGPPGEIGLVDRFRSFGRGGGEVHGLPLKPGGDAAVETVDVRSEVDLAAVVDDRREIGDVHGNGGYELNLTAAAH